MGTPACELPADPIGLSDLDGSARLRDLAKRAGVAISDNDLRIAATASTQSHPLVTCDWDQFRLEADLPAGVILSASVTVSRA